MKFRVIVSLFASVFVTLAAVQPSLAAPSASNTQADAVITDMAQAFKRGDRKRLSALLPQAKGHLLEPWAAYWELKARLDEASHQEVRAFFTDPTGRLIEDPVTGSLNASAAAWMLREGHVTAPYGATQGTRLGRSGRIRIEQDDTGTIWVGGRTATLFAGTTQEPVLC